MPPDRRSSAIARTFLSASFAIAASPRSAPAEPVRYTRSVDVPWPADPPCAGSPRVLTERVRPREVFARYREGSAGPPGELELGSASEVALSSAAVSLELVCARSERFARWSCDARGCSVYASYAASRPWSVEAEADWKTHPAPEAVLALAGGRRGGRSGDLAPVARAFARLGLGLMEAACPDGRCTRAVTSCRAPVAALAKSPLEQWSVVAVRSAQVKLLSGGDTAPGGEAVFSVRADPAASVVLACREVEESERPVRCALAVERGACRWSYTLDTTHETHRVEVPGGHLVESGRILVAGAALATSAAKRSGGD